MRFKPTTIYLICFAIFVTLLIILAVSYLKPKYKYEAPATIVATSFKSAAPLKPFALTDTTGTQFTEKSLRGHWTLIFFGYTLCPDICPKTLGIVRDSWQIFASNNQPPPVRFVFADMSRTPVPTAELQHFVQNYNPTFLGLSGPPEQMHQLSDQLGIYVQQLPDKMDHTAALMLIDTQGRLRAVLTPPFTAQDIVHDLQLLTR